MYPAYKESNCACGPQGKMRLSGQSEEGNVHPKGGGDFQGKVRRVMPA